MHVYEGQAIAWCAFAPREDFIRLERSRVHKRIDQLPVWSIPCFFVHKDFRRQGVTSQLLKGVIQYARQQKIEIIEAYPTIPTKVPLADSFGWIGVYSAFEKAGFKIVDRTSKNRPMVRYLCGRARLMTRCWMLDAGSMLDADADAGSDAGKRCWFIQYQVSSIQYLQTDTDYRIPITENRLPITEYRIPPTD